MSLGEGEYLGRLSLGWRVCLPISVSLSVFISLYIALLFSMSVVCFSVVLFSVSQLHLMSPLFFSLMSAPHPVASVQQKPRYGNRQQSSCMCVHEDTSHVTIH